jgi:hypothetical protein
MDRDDWPEVEELGCWVPLVVIALLIAAAFAWWP